MNQRALVAELIGTFMLMSSVLGAAFYSFAAPAGAAGILGVALSIGCTVMALAFAIGHISGGHFNPAVTLGLVAGGRVSGNSAVGYIIAQCIGALIACALFALIGHAPPTFAANGYDTLSMLHAGLISVFLIETVLSAFLVFVIMGATSKRAPAGFAPIAIGARLRYTSWPSRSPTPRLTRRAAWATPWSPKARPIPGGVIGCSIARWLPGDGRRVRHFAPGAGPRGKEGA